MTKEVLSLCPWLLGGNFLPDKSVFVYLVTSGCPVIYANNVVMVGDLGLLSIGSVSVRVVVMWVVNCVYMTEIQ